MRAQSRHREAQQKDDKAKQAWRTAMECVGGQPPRRPGKQQRGKQQTGRTEPERRLEGQAEVRCDADTQSDRQPQQPALALGKEVGDEPGKQIGPGERPAEGGPGGAARLAEMKGRMRHHRLCARPPRRHLMRTAVYLL
jgi:hypothetical protein